MSRLSFRIRYFSSCFAFFSFYYNGSDLHSLESDCKLKRPHFRPLEFQHSCIHVIVSMITGSSDFYSYYVVFLFKNVFTDLGIIQQSTKLKLSS